MRTCKTATELHKEGCEAVNPRLEDSGERGQSWTLSPGLPFHSVNIHTILGGQTATCQISALLSWSRDCHEIQHRHMVERVKYALLSYTHLFWLGAFLGAWKFFLSATISKLQQFLFEKGEMTLFISFCSCIFKSEPCSPA